MLEKKSIKNISIDFVAGSHGNFLEYVCNRFVAGIPVDFEPFNSIGSSHNKSHSYEQQRVFHAWHWSEFDQPTGTRIIRIVFDHDDLLPLSSVSLLRAGDMNINNDELHIDTYNKLNNEYYQSVVHALNVAYPFLKLSVSNPDCPRFVLREYFKFGFKDPEQHGLVAKQKKMFRYNNHFDVFDFKFKNFYSPELFFSAMKDLSVWSKFDLIEFDLLEQLHKEFLNKQIYKNHKQQADQIIQAVIKNRSCDIPKLTLMQESYINGVLERIYNVEMPYEQHQYFDNTQQIVQHLGL